MDINPNDLNTCTWEGSEYIFLSSHGDSCVIKSFEAIDSNDVIFVDCEEIDIIDKDVEETRLVPLEEAQDTEIYKMLQMLCMAILRTPKAVQELYGGPKVVSFPFPNGEQALQVRVGITQTKQEE